MRHIPGMEEQYRRHSEGIGPCLLIFWLISNIANTFSSPLLYLFAVPASRGQCLFCSCGLAALTRLRYWQNLPLNRILYVHTHTHTTATPTRTKYVVYCKAHAAYFLWVVLHACIQSSRIIVFCLAIEGYVCVCSQQRWFWRIPACTCI